MAQQSTGSDRIQTAAEGLVDATNHLASRITILATEIDNLRYVAEYLQPWQDSARRVRITNEAHGSDTA